MQVHGLMQFNICSPTEPGCYHSYLATTSAVKKNTTQGYSAGVFPLFLAPAPCKGSWASLVWGRNINVALINLSKVRGEGKKQWVQPCLDNTLHQSSPPASPKILTSSCCAQPWKFHRPQRLTAPLSTRPRARPATAAPNQNGFPATMAQGCTCGLPGPSLYQLHGMTAETLPCTHTEERACSWKQWFCHCTTKTGAPQQKNPSTKNPGRSPLE